MKLWINKKRGLAACGALMCLGSVSYGEGIDPAYQGMAMFGIDRATGHMMRFDFPTSTQTDVGLVRDSVGTGLSGIEGSAYIPGFTKPLHVLARPGR